MIWAFYRRSEIRSEVVVQELTKALANGKRVTFQGPESGASGRFQPIPNIAVTNAFAVPFAPTAMEKTSTLALAERRAFQPNGNTDLSKADAAMRHALANGTRG